MKKKPYTLTDIARMAEIDEQTILHYEEEGFIAPATEKDQKFYTDDDLEEVKMIRRLTEELGVNLAGVEVILNMRQQILDMQLEFEKMLAQMKKQFLKEFKGYESRLGRRLIESKSGKIVKVEIDD